MATVTEPPATETETERLDDGWQRNKQGRKFVRARGRQGIVYRQGDETVEQALERDAKPKDTPPRAKPKKVVPPKPTTLKSEPATRSLSPVWME